MCCVCGERGDVAPGHAVWFGFRHKLLNKQTKRVVETVRVAAFLCESSTVVKFDIVTVIDTGIVITVDVIVITVVIVVRAVRATSDAAAMTVDRQHVCFFLLFLFFLWTFRSTARCDRGGAWG